MFDAGKQDAANMKTALNVAKEWLTGYAQMGEKGAATAPSSGSKVPSFADWQKGNH